MTRVLVVDDSAFVRTVVGDALLEAGYVVETAPDGATAIDAVERFRPDVITMDVEMPGIDGTETVERIMTSRPTPIVVLSVHTDAGGEATMDALAHGAMDVLRKPDGSDDRTLEECTGEILETVERLSNADCSSLALARVTASATRTTRAGTRGTNGNSPSASANGSRQTTDVDRRRAVAATASTEPPATTEPPKRAGTVHERVESTAAGTGVGMETDALRDADVVRNADAVRDTDVDLSTCPAPTVVIGASTGGPRIVERILSELPLELGARVIVVQHMPGGFTARFATRLDRTSPYAVTEAESESRVRPGEAVVAPGDRHLRCSTARGETVTVSPVRGERIHGVRPSIDVTMTSAATAISEQPLVGIVLSGMGRDGSRGVEAIHEAGGTTFAQNERTSPVFGMARAAIETGAVDAVVSPAAIPGRVIETVAPASAALPGGGQHNG